MNAAAPMMGAMAVNVAPQVAAFNAQAAQVGLGNNLTTQQMSNAVRQQVGVTQTSQRLFVRDRANMLSRNTANLGANGRRTAQAMANSNATTLGMSSQAALLSTAGRRLPQNSMLRSRPNSLVSRVSTVSATGGSLRLQAAFQNVINRQIGNSSLNNRNGTMTNSVGSNAMTSLFVTGANPMTGLSTTSVVNGVANVSPTGVSTTPLTSTVFNTGVQNALTMPFQSLLTSLNTTSSVSTTPLTSTGFNTGVQNALTMPFQSLITPLNTTSSVTTTPGAGVTIAGLFGSQSMGTTSNNGVVTTSSGSPGFGAATTSFNTNVGTGSNNLMSGVNSQIGFLAPSLVAGTGTGTRTAAVVRVV